MGLIKIIEKNRKYRENNGGYKNQFDIVDIIKAPLQDTAKIVNESIVSPAAKPTGEILSFIPRAMQPYIIYGARGWSC